MKIQIKKLHENAVIPTYAHEGDACFDLTAATVDGYGFTGSVIDHNQPVFCGTGLAVDVPEGHVMLVFSRSGHGFKKNIRLSNGTGIIDSTYRGEVMVKLASDAPMLDDGGEYLPQYRIKPGDRIAQAMIIPVQSCTFEVVEQLSLSERGSNGFGSSDS